MTPTPESHDLRVLVLAPFGQDASMAAEILGEAGMASAVCRDIDHVCDELNAGAGALLIAYEALTDNAIRRLADALEQQEAWSDIPILVFTPGKASMMARHGPGKLEVLRNVTVVERPIRVAALVSCLRSALRARERQYLVRSLMEELRRSNRTKDAFVAAVSHELRTPLNAILGWTAIARRSSDPAGTSLALDTIERNGHVLSQLVEDLLDMARIAHGQFRLNPSSIDLTGVVNAAVGAVRPAVEGKRVELDVLLSAGVPRTVADPTRLQQVLWNLLWNAVKFTPEGGRIQVRLRPDQRASGERRAIPRAVEIVIADTGCGIAPELLPYIFEPFRQGHDSNDGGRRGLGLGLAIVKHLVELHGGSVTAHSEGRNRGATFHVRLPVLHERIALPQRSILEPTLASDDTPATF